jgi:hypothetical protein
MQIIWELNWFLHANYYLLIIINVKLTPSGLTAYRSVWMSRRCAGLVGFRWAAFAWIAGANLRCRLLSLSFRLWLGVSCLWIYVLFMLRSFIHCRISEISFMISCCFLWHVNSGDVWIISAATVANFICMYVGLCWDVASISWIFSVFACFIA